MADADDLLCPGCVGGSRKGRDALLRAVLVLRRAVEAVFLESLSYQFGRGRCKNPEEAWNG